MTTITNANPAPPRTDVGEPPFRFVSAVLADDALMEEFEEFLMEDPAIKQEALRAAAEMRNLPMDELDRRPMEAAKRRVQADGKVGRRAPGNPFHSPMLGKYKTKTMAKEAKVDDPALQHNPLRGRLLVTISVNAALLMIFIQALVANRITTGSFYASRAENSNLGPTALTLTDLGGLNTNQIRRGAWIRLLWSMWMHSGWIHIGLNIICQLQYFYMLEPDWGSIRTLLLFWFAGISGNLLSCIMDPCKTTVGSSGGLFGLMGGVIPYCIEFWHSIPRPLCILIFSIVTFVLTLATGLSKATDTWAHLGGLVGGLLFGFGTITTPAAFLPKEKVLKKQLRKNAVMRWLQQTINPDCKCGIREWSIRLISWGLLGTMWALCFVFLLIKYDYQPPGSLTYSGITKCCCCYDLSGDDAELTRATWNCMSCDIKMNNGETWQAFCARTQNITHRRLLSEVDTFGDGFHIADDHASMWNSTNYTL